MLSDYQAIQELEAFGYATSGADAARLALTAGVDIEMGVQVPSQYSTYTNYGPDLVKTGQVSMATINNDVRHVLTLKFLAGLFAHPFTDPTRVQTRGAHAREPGGGAGHGRPFHGAAEQPEQRAPAEQPACRRSRWSGRSPTTRPTSSARTCRSGTRRRT